MRSPLLCYLNACVYLTLWDFRFHSFISFSNNKNDSVCDRRGPDFS